MTRARSFTSFTSQLCLVQGRVMPTVSHSWKASLPIRCVGTCAGDADERDGIHQRVGERRHHVGRAGSGGDEHDARLAGRAGIAFRRVAGALLVADQDVLHLVLLEQLVVDRKHGAARIAENVLHALIGQGPHDHLGAGHLLWHLTSLPNLGSSAHRNNKKGPRRDP